VEAAERVAMTGMLGAAVAQAAELVPEGRVLPPITVKPLVEILLFKAVRKLTMMHLVAEVAEATNTEVMDVLLNMGEVLAEAVVIQVEQPLVMVVEVFIPLVAAEAEVVPRLALQVAGVVYGAHTAQEMEVL
jgi:hypothetical protein